MSLKTAVMVITEGMSAPELTNNSWNLFNKSPAVIHSKQMFLWSIEIASVMSLYSCKLHYMIWASHFHCCFSFSSFKLIFVTNRTMTTDRIRTLCQL